MSEKTVTLLASDVECLLLASAAVKEIEAKLVSMGDDPTFQRRRGHIEEAFGRINTARREATRVIEDPEYDVPPTAEMIEIMYRIFKRTYLRSIDPTDGVISGLVRRRMIVLGTEEAFLKWGDNTRDILPTNGMVAKLSARGLHFIEGGGQPNPALVVYPTKEE